MAYTTLQLGNWNAICDVCGVKYKASQLKKRWDGLMVCEEDWESRHPQDFIRGHRESNQVPWTRPVVPDQFIQVTYADTGTCTATGMLGQADYGTAGCMIVGNINGNLVN